MRSTISLLVGTLLALPSFTHANPVWTAAASTCAVDEGSVAKYNHGGADFGLKGTTTGTVLARCNVSNPLDSGGNPNWNALEITYRDPSNPNNRVLVDLYRVNPSTGLAAIITTFDSNTHSQSSSVQTCARSFTHAFNFDSSAYVVQLRASRTSSATGNNPTIFIVRLLDTSPAPPPPPCPPIPPPPPPPPPLSLE